MAPRIELVAGIAATVLALLALAALLTFTPVETVTCSSTQVDGETIDEECTTTRESVWDDDDTAAIAVVAAIVLGMSVTVSGGAWLHVQRGHALGKGLVVAGTGALTLMTLLAMLSIGVFFVPATVAAIVASVAAMRAPAPAAS
jgi:hypothetical protein